MIKTLGIVCILSSLTATAQAEFRPDTSGDSAPQGVTVSTAPRYFKPVDPSAPQSPDMSTGTRSGGCFGGETAPSILAPDSFVGLTADAQPVLTWLLPNDDPVPVEFSFYALGAEGADDMKHMQTLAYEPGINQYQLPDGVTLEPGQRYLWQLILQCNPNRPSSALVYEAEIEFVPMPEMSQQALDRAANVLEKSEAFAKAGYWYDAIAVLGQGQEPSTLTMRNALLNDLALLEDEAN